MILLLRERATPQQLELMLQQHKFYIKTAVDIERRVLTGGGELHADCEKELLKDGSRQQDIWAASFMPTTGRIIYESMVNLRPRQNRKMEIIDPSIREKVAQMINEFLGDL
ncbi:MULTISPECIES: DUF5674 family protein [Nostoc]|uniref:Uncharacterized protein n=1 Tax=Nostoc paludosum FACHB-159 TaxID=2692908 RepID=A0ABR8KMK4_9NOSO|nr:MULTISPECIES: DUF5674 family protein [Nostoc]MBD2683456.1 hypothetical protein [Nostoc sp. FACHB-857]MBD2739779.1 hypothetical protein [Nostoc paludosum FACHB-159]